MVMSWNSGNKPGDTKGRTAPAVEGDTQIASEQGEHTVSQSSLEAGRERLHKLLLYAHKFNASDIHIKPNSPPLFRISGKLMAPKGATIMRSDEVRLIVQAIASPKQLKDLDERHDLDCGYSHKDLGRFRVNVHHQLGNLGLALRAIASDVPDFSTLNLPEVVAKIADDMRGLVLVTGATSSGKSTTLASIIDYINARRSCHIVTIEDPIEYIFTEKKSFITQREVGLDTQTFASALKFALRQDPDVILLGELRDIETIETAMTAAETGHMVMSTMHTTDATETISRILSVYPEARQAMARMRLAGLLKSVISQRLVPRADGKGRVLAAEVMINTGHIKDLILDPTKTADIRSAIAEGHDAYGMQTFDQSLTALVQRDLVTFDIAMDYATSPTDFALQFQGVQMSTGGNNEWMDMGQKKEQGRGDESFLSDDFDLDKF